MGLSINNPSNLNIQVAQPGRGPNQGTGKVKKEIGSGDAHQLGKKVRWGAMHRMGQKSDPQRAASASDLLNKAAHAVANLRYPPER